MILRTAQEASFTEEQMKSALAEAGLESVLTRVGGLDSEQDWQSLLSFADQQQLALVRLILADLPTRSWIGLGRR